MHWLSRTGEALQTETTYRLHWTHAAREQRPSSVQSAYKQRTNSARTRSKKSYINLLPFLHCLLYPEHGIWVSAWKFCRLQLNSSIKRHRGGTFSLVLYIWNSQYPPYGLLRNPIRWVWWCPSVLWLLPSSGESVAIFKPAVNSE